MIHDTVQEIIAAEKEAERMNAQALEDARVSVAQAEKESEKITKDVVDMVKEERRKVVANALSDGEKLYNQIVAGGKQNVARLQNATDTDKAAQFIKEKVFSEYVNR